MKDEEEQGESVRSTDALLFFMGVDQIAIQLF